MYSLLHQQLMAVSGRLHAPAALALGENPLNRTLVGSQNGSGRFGEQKNLLPLPTPTELSQLHSP